MKSMPARPPSPKSIGFGPPVESINAVAIRRAPGPAAFVPRLTRRRRAPWVGAAFSRDLAAADVSGSGSNARELGDPSYLAFWEDQAREFASIRERLQSANEAEDAQR